MKPTAGKSADSSQAESGSQSAASKCRLIIHRTTSFEAGPRSPKSHARWALLPRRAASCAPLTLKMRPDFCSGVKRLWGHHRDCLADHPTIVHILLVGAVDEYMEFWPRLGPSLAASAVLPV
jgi:hypothetical protein